jgi:hypothetical protein
VTEEKKNQEQEEPGATEAWNEVGKQFQTLGKSLAAAINATAQDEQVQQELNKMQAALDTTAAQIKQKAKEVSDSLESRKVEEETRKLEEQAQAAGQELVKEVQPQLVDVLKKMRAGLDQTINDLEQLDPAAASAEPTPAEAWNEVGQQVQTLGESLTAAVNASVQDEQVEQKLNKMQAELDAASQQISQKIKPESDEEQTQATGRELVKEVQPFLLSALKKMQTGLDQVVDDLEEKGSELSSTDEEAGSEETTAEIANNSEVKEKTL